MAFLVCFFVDLDLLLVFLSWGWGLGKCWGWGCGLGSIPHSICGLGHPSCEGLGWMGLRLGSKKVRKCIFLFYNTYSLEICKQHLYHQTIHKVTPTIFTLKKPKYTPTVFNLEDYTYSNVKIINLLFLESPFLLKINVKK